MGFGDQALCLANGHKTVLLVTDYAIGINIHDLKNALEAILTDKEKKEFCLEIPTLRAIDVDLYRLINPAHRKAAKSDADLRYPLLKRQIEKTNFIFKMSRYDGTLLNAQTLRYKEKSINDLERSLKTTLAILHHHGYSHNDIFLKNIFYKGEYPKLKFFLGDCGSITKNPPSMHAARCDEDLRNVKRIVEKMKEILDSKYALKLKARDSDLPSFENHRLKKMGVSPLKPNPTESKLKEDSPPKIFKI